MVIVLVVELNIHPQFYFIRSCCEGKTDYFLPFYSSVGIFQFHFLLHFVANFILNF